MFEILWYNYIYYIFALTICCTCKLYMGVKSRRGKKSGGKKTGGKKSANGAFLRNRKKW